MSLCPNLWVIVSTCITKWAQSHSGSLRKSEHGCHRAWVRVTLEDLYTFHANTSLKTKGCARASHCAPKPSYFYTNRHTREAQAMFNLWSSSWKRLQSHTGRGGSGRAWKVSREQWGSFTDNKLNEMASYRFSESSVSVYTACSLNLLQSNWPQPVMTCFEYVYTVVLFFFLNLKTIQYQCDCNFFF